MKKDKNTKQAAKKLDKQEKAARNAEREFQQEKQIRLDTLQGLRQMAAAEIVLDTTALDELISQVQNGTVPTWVRMAQ